MLKKMNIENVAVIERAELEFDSGFNVLTGETGAGKSIIIDALGAVLGERTTRDIVRAGENNANISALFEQISSSTVSQLETLGISVDENNSLFLQRTISADGKGSCYVGTKPVTVSILREIGRLLVNTHGQHENQKLLNPDKHVEYLDRLGNYLQIRDTYQARYHEYCAIHKELKKLQVNEEELERKVDLFSFQLQEIEEANITVGEEEQLKEKALFFKNSESISDALKKSSHALSSCDDQTESVSQRIQTAVNALNTISDKYPQAKELEEKLYTVLAEFDECEDKVTNLVQTLSFDESERELVEERLSTIHRLMNKYGQTEEEILNFGQQCRKDLDLIEHSDERRQELENKLEAAQDVMVEAANALTQARKKAAKEFVEKVGNELTFLNMPRVKLDVQITKAPLTVMGAEKVEFCISANPGEPSRSIAKIASGGELSRIMLAIKAVLADVDDIDTLIFDEIDNGISGQAAQKVGTKLRQIALSQIASRQILCVTHLAQIASQAHHHLLIEKKVVNDRTYTSVTPLDEMGRRRELARIISGEVTSSALDAADEMLSRSR